MSVITHPWNWSTSGTVMAGQMMTDTNDWQNATELRLAQQTQDGIDVALELGLFFQGVLIRVQAKADSTKTATYAALGPGVDQGPYWRVPVHLVQMTGVAPSNNTALQLWAVTAGDAPQNHVCQDFDAKGLVIHKSPVRYIHDDPNTMPTIWWCDYCHAMFVTI